MSGRETAGTPSPSLVQFPPLGFDPSGQLFFGRQTELIFAREYAPEQPQRYSYSLKMPSVPVFKLNKLVEPTARRTANDAGLNTTIYRDAVSA